MKSKLSFVVQANYNLIVDFVSKKTRSRHTKIAFLVNEYLGILKEVDFSFVHSDFVPVMYVRHNAENTSLIKQTSTYFKLEIILYLE